eukprot:gene29379-64544_t
MRGVWQVHRNLGAHLSKVKSCMGTYIWCPDEVEQYARDKYERRRWPAGGAAGGTTADDAAAGDQDGAGGSDDWGDDW